MEPTNHPFRKKMTFQTSMIMFHVNLQGCRKNHITITLMIIHPIQPFQHQPSVNTWVSRPPVVRVPPLIAAPWRQK